MMYIQKQSQSRRRGFGLVETLVSILIFSAVVGSIIAATISSLGTLRSIEDRLVALYLAEEGMEYVKNMRDERTLLGVSGDWLGGDLRGCLGAGIQCTVDSAQIDSSNALHVCAVSGCEPLRYDAATGEYGYDVTVAPSKFTRIVKLTNPDLTGTGDDEVRIDVVVTWGIGSQIKDFTLQHNIFNWQQ